jgi:hypothetical protein
MCFKCFLVFCVVVFLMHATGNLLGRIGADALVLSLPLLTGLQMLLLHGDDFSMWLLS